VLLLSYAQAPLWLGTGISPKPLTRFFSLPEKKLVKKRGIRFAGLLFIKKKQNRRRFVIGGGMWVTVGIFALFSLCSA
jgi:hypothetical protein